jgi:cytochrome c peroxidase
MRFAHGRGSMRMESRGALVALTIASVLGCATNPGSATTERVGDTTAGDHAADPRPSASRVTLGRFLFHDKRVSRNRDAACSGCHTLSKFGVDGKPAGGGAGAPGEAPNTPRVFNTQAHVAQIWDARAADAQVLTVDVALAAALGRVPRYADLFRSAFPNEARAISLKNVSEALEAFERGLVGNSRWDKFSAGDVSALTLEEKHGLRVFLESGCVACHTGPQVGGAMYQEVGIAYPWPKQKDARAPGEADAIAARLILRVPSLKNIAESAPYFHDSSTSNLEAAIRLMGHHQLGVELSNDDVNAIAAWMRSLSGDVDPAYIAVPDLPPEG